MTIKIKYLLVLLITVPSIILAQDFSNSWIGHFSYLDIKDISQGESKVYGAAENAIFVYDTQTNVIDKLSTINGLSGENISSIKYVESEGILFVGFENGLMQVYNESSRDFLTVVDILDKPAIPPNDKKINDFMIYNGFVYISTDYGISLYDINNLEFGDTYFIGPAGSQIQVNQTAILENEIFAATEASIFRADINNPNLIDFQQWTSFGGLINWVGVKVINDIIYFARNNSLLYEYSNSILSIIQDYSGLIQDIRAFNNQLVVATTNEVHVYSVDPLTEIALVTPTEDFDANFTAAILNSNNDIYIGTKGTLNQGKEGLGILKTNILDTSFLEEIHPESPLLNRFFQVRTQGGQIWGTHGGHSVTFNPFTPYIRTGLSHFIDDEWANIPYREIEETVPSPRALSYLSINPFNSNEVYLSSSLAGLLFIKDGVIDTWYTQDNSSLVPLFGEVYFMLASEYDKNGALWIMNGRVNESLNKLENGQWTSFSLQDIIDPPVDNLGFSDIAFTDDGKVFVSSLDYGIIGFNESNGDLKFIRDIDLGLPFRNTWTVTTDRQNQVWLGTSRGLRVIFNPSEFFDDPSYQLSNIVILDDGTPRELLFQQYITDIEVDGSNNKWIGTLDTGAYYLSSDGQETIFHFTKDNSPIPSNEILDIDIDDVNGLVYFATPKGLVAFKSETSKPEETLENAYTFPNPVRPNFNINIDKIKIKGLTNNVNIKITDIEGNLVTEAESRTNAKFKGYNLEIDGGTALWNGKNLGNVTVASGVYLVLITDLDSLETKVLKVMLVR